MRSGVIIILVSLLAIWAANGPLSSFYHLLLYGELGVSWQGFVFEKPLLSWVNEGLMAVFFYAVTCEIRGSFTDGLFAKRNFTVLPVSAALAGVVFPACIFYLFNSEAGPYMDGWAIPTATDIAFSLAVLYLLGKNFSANLRMTLLAIAVIDDLIAIVVIAFFYSQSISTQLLLLALIPICVMGLLRMFKNKYVWYYTACAFVLWLLVLKSGVHATLSGVIMALLVPSNIANQSISSLEKLTLYIIMPVFAFCNAGFTMTGLTINIVNDSLFQGVFLGLVVGKPLGICAVFFLFQYYLLKQNFLSTRETFTLGCLCGIGFTMSLFIGILAFDDDPRVYANIMRLAVLSASALSAIFAYVAMRFKVRREK